MTEPLSLDVILGEFNSEDEVWVLRDANSGLYVTIPHPAYPGRAIIHFFMSRNDAMRVLAEIEQSGNEKIAKAPIVPVSVKLHESIKRIAETRKPGFADGFVVHSPNEVFEFLWPRE